MPRIGNGSVDSTRYQRRRLKDDIAWEVDDFCECCNFRPGIDLHEVFVRRSAVPKHLQHEIFVRGNCALVCIQCHRADIGQQPPAETPAFKARFARRLLRLGYTPYKRKRISLW